jgi:hypothetical protein
MSEARDAVRRRVLGGFAAAFLMGAGYSQSAVLKFGDLSGVTAERIQELLTSKLHEQKDTIEWAKTRHIQIGIGARKKLKRARKK